ncbi:MAG: hypothetical protein WBP22_00685 [Candidatus Saccharimonas sp.]
MILTLLTMIGVGMVAVSAVPYILAVMRGQVRPKLVSWGIWTVLAVIMTLAALEEGQLQSALLTGVTVAACASVMVLGWRQGSRQMNRLDVLCIIGAVVGVLVYFMVDSPLVALIVSVVVDAIAFIPTLVHAWTDPEEESLASFAVAASGELFVVVAAVAGAASFAGLLYPVYAVVFNGAVAALIIAARYRALDSESADELV